MGVLANHVPSIEQLKPGLVEVIEEAGGSKQFFCTFEHTFPRPQRIQCGSKRGARRHIADRKPEQCLVALQPSSPARCSASTPLKATHWKTSAPRYVPTSTAPSECQSNTALQAVRNQISEAQKIAQGSGSEQDIAEAKIELEVGTLVCILFL